MNKKTLTLIIVVALIGIIAIWMVSAYNTLVTVQEQATTAWANVETGYQRRMDLIPNLVNTVKGYAAHESETLESVVEARAKATSAPSIDPTQMTEEQMAAYQHQQSQIGDGIGRLLAVVESYPDLKASTNFLALQSQLEGTENRINVARREYNEAVQAYNAKVRHFPGNIVASLFGFDRMIKFQADEGAQNAPKVEF